MSSDFRLRNFNATSDGAWYGDWWRERGYEEPAPMPKIAVVIEVNGQPAAAGGVALTDSDFCLLEGFCNNPEFDQKTRDEALKLVGAWAIDTAISMGYKRILMMTESAKISELCQVSAQYAIMKGVDFRFRAFPNHKVYELKRV